MEDLEKIQAANRRTPDELFRDGMSLLNEGLKVLSQVFQNWLRACQQNPLKPLIVVDDVRMVVWSSTDSSKRGIRSDTPGFSGRF